MADWPPNDLIAGADETTAALAELGVEIPRPRDLDALLQRLGQGLGPGASPSVGRDLVTRRLVSAANSALAGRGDARRLIRVVAVGDEKITTPTFVLVDKEDRAALAREGVVLEELGRMIATRLVPIALAVITIALALIAVISGKRHVWIAALVVWILWLVARLVGPRLAAEQRPSRA